MRYIKYFKENITKVQSREEYIQEIITFFEEHLVEMLDLGYKVDIVDFNPIVKVSLRKRTNGGPSPLWGEIKNYYMQFLTILLESYSIKRQRNSTSEDAPMGDIIIYSTFYNIEDVFNDNIPDDALASEIRVYIK